MIEKIYTPTKKLTCAMREIYDFYYNSNLSEIELNLSKIPCKLRKYLKIDYYLREGNINYMNISEQTDKVGKEFLKFLDDKFNEKLFDTNEKNLVKTFFDAFNLYTQTFGEQYSFVLIAEENRSTQEKLNLFIPKRPFYNKISGSVWGGELLTRFQAKELQEELNKQGIGKHYEKYGWPPFGTVSLEGWGMNPLDSRLERLYFRLDNIIKDGPKVETFSRTSLPKAAF